MMNNASGIFNGENFQEGMSEFPSLISKGVEHDNLDDTIGYISIIDENQRAPTD